mmetsp:Transcript_18217/g.37671  ORF Transcript_18217/g.37671 Transcript_18217/m.37671 type:complete len:214 (-) Transcript_18217:439-1080(-)
MNNSPYHHTRRAFANSFVHLGQFGIALFPGNAFATSLISMRHGRGLKKAFRSGLPREDMAMGFRQGCGSMRQGVLEQNTKFIMGMILQTIGKLSKKGIGRMMRNNDKFAHGQGFGGRGTEHLCNAWIQKNLVRGRQGGVIQSSHEMNGNFGLFFSIPIVVACTASTTAATCVKSSFPTSQKGLGNFILFGTTAKDIHFKIMTRGFLIPRLQGE